MAADEAAADAEPCRAVGGRKVSGAPLILGGRIRPSLFPAFPQVSLPAVLRRSCPRLCCAVLCCGGRAPACAADTQIPSIPGVYGQPTAVLCEGCKNLFRNHVSKLLLLLGAAVRGRRIDLHAWMPEGSFLREADGRPRGQNLMPLEQRILCCAANRCPICLPRSQSLLALRAHDQVRPIHFSDAMAVPAAKSVAVHRQEEEEVEGALARGSGGDIQRLALGLYRIASARLRAGAAHGGSAGFPAACGAAAHGA
jgi:hypothetical protein